MRRLRCALDGALGNVRPAPALWVLATFAAVALTFGFAQSALAGEADTIEGIVTSATTKAPVKGVQVCAGRFVYEQKCVNTGIDGTYVVPAPAVPVHVEFNAPPGSGLVSHTFYNNAYIPSKAAELVPVGESSPVSMRNCCLKVASKAWSPTCPRKHRSKASKFAPRRLGNGPKN